jgi:hypothetical protein
VEPTFWWAQALQGFAGHATSDTCADPHDQHDNNNSSSYNYHYYDHDYYYYSGSDNDHNEGDYHGDRSGDNEIAVACVDDDNDDEDDNGNVTCNDDIVSNDVVSVDHRRTDTSTNHPPTHTVTAFHITIDNHYLNNLDWLDYNK